MKGYDSPNYTQTPNELFDALLPDLSLAELKVTLAIIRQTFGWHRDSHELSISFLMKASGLSRQAVVDGLERALARGYVKREKAGKTFRYWLQVNDLDSQGTGPSTVKEVDRSSVNGSDPKKEREEKERKERSSGVRREEIQKVWDHYRTQRTANVQRASELPAAPPVDETKIIREALKVATVAECCKAIDGLFGSDFHQQRGEGKKAGRRHTRLSDVLKAKRASQHGSGYTLRERIDFFCERRDQQLHAGGKDQEDWRQRSAREQGL